MLAVLWTVLLDPEQMILAMKFTADIKAYCILHAAQFAGQQRAARPHWSSRRGESSRRSVFDLSTIHWNKGRLSVCNLHHIFSLDFEPQL